MCHKRFSNYLGFKSHVSSEYRRFEKTFGRQAKDWQEIVDAFNSKPVEETSTKRLDDFDN